MPYGGRIFAAAVMACALALPAPAHADATFRLSHNQRISCSKILMPGKRQVIACKSYAYLFNTTTSEFYRCEAQVSVTRDISKILGTEGSGTCRLRTKVFSENSNYDFDAVETEPPNTNAFFGSGGTAIWAADVSTRKVRGCIELATGISSPVLKCMDMNFE
ncbi:hypothetical protein [[Pseudomonas] carboxydohydrogena]